MQSSSKLLSKKVKKMPLTESVRELIRLTKDPKYLPPRLKEAYEFVKENQVVTSHEYTIHKGSKGKYSAKIFSDLYKLGMIKRVKTNIYDRTGVSGYQYEYFI
jgi:hypothetical protein